MAETDSTKAEWYHQLLVTYRIPIILGAGSIVLIVISSILLLKSVQTTAPIQFSHGEATVAGQISTSIQIDIEGAVKNPGLYSLPEGTRVEDAIAMAGGLTEEADLALIARTINRATKLRDGGKLFFPSVGESASQQKTSSKERSGLVSVNTASQQSLEALAGIGPVTAKKIIDARPYQTLEELVAKKAVGSSLLEKLKDQLTL